MSELPSRFPRPQWPAPMPQSTPAPALAHGLRASFALPDPGPGERSDELRLRDYLSVLRRRWRWVVAMLALGVGVGAWTTFRTRPLYEAHTTLRIESPESQTPILSELAALEKGSSLATEIQTLRSRSLAEDVVGGLGLNVRPVEPARGESSSLTERLRAGLGRASPRRGAAIDSAAVVAEVEPGRYRLRYAEGIWSILHEGGDRVLAQARAAEALQFAGVRIWPRTLSPAPSAATRRSTAPGGRAADDIELEVGGLAAAVGGFTGRLDVSVPEREANVVRITYRDTDPELARAAANALAATFIANAARADKSQARSTREFIEGQLRELSRSIEQGEEELRAYREQAGVVSFPAEAEQAITTFGAFEADRRRYAAERDALVSLVSGGPDAAGGDSDLATFPSFIDNEAVQQLKKQQNELAALKARLLVDKTSAHPEVVAVEKQIQRVQTSLRSAARGYRRSLDSKIAALDRTLAGMRADLERMPEKEIRLAQLMRAGSAQGEVYAELQMKLREAQIAEAVELASIRILDAAALPQAPVGPDPLSRLAMAALLGLLLGCGAAFAREQLDGTLRTEEHAERELNLPMLGSVPVLPKAGRLLPARRPLSRALRPGGGPALVDSPRRAGSVGLPVTARQPRSGGAEAYRTLTSNLEVLSPLRGRAECRRLLVTSAGPGEGKTTVAANLATAFAQEGVLTVLIDADLRRSDLHRIFGVERRKGLADYLAGEAQLKDVMHETRLPWLYVIPAGSAPRLPFELLRSERMDRLMGQLATRARAVILDSPPLLPVADAAALSRKVDDVLVVIRWGRTDRTALATALRPILAAAPGRVLGVLNGIDYRQAYGRGFYQQYYHPYYSDGGLEEIVAEAARKASEQGAAEIEVAAATARVDVGGEGSGPPVGG